MNHLIIAINFLRPACNQSQEMQIWFDVQYHCVVVEWQFLPHLAYDDGTNLWILIERKQASHSLAGVDAESH